MNDIRIVRAGPHALTLLADIRENALRNGPSEIREFLFDDYGELHEHATETSTHYFTGFRDHSPYGYLLACIDDKEAELKGPFLYPEYLEPALPLQLVEHAIHFLQGLKVQLIYTLVPSGCLESQSAFSDTQFEDLSSDTEFLQRWHDGILAHRRIPADTKLFVRLLEISEPQSDSD